MFKTYFILLSRVLAYFSNDLKACQCQPSHDDAASISSVDVELEIGCATNLVDVEENDPNLMGKADIVDVTNIDVECIDEPSRSGK